MPIGEGQCDHPGRNTYGTFSCTLEGFDESFDTMKAIAEYFRDLAADDRYFGAEPPTPDAEMLARIAEREISRRVQASEEQGKIVLRADHGAAQDRAEATTTAQTQDARADTAVVHAEPGQYSAPQLAAFLADTKPEVVAKAAEHTAPADDAPEQAEPPQPEAEVRPAPKDLPAQEPPVASDTDDGMTVDPEIAEDATVEEEPSATVEPEVAEDATVEEEPSVTDAPEVAEDATVEEPSDVTDASQDPQDLPEAASLPETEAPVTEDLPEPEDTDSAELAGAEPADMHDEAEAKLVFATETITEEALSEEDSVAAKLRRIRSVVVQKDLDYEISEYSEDEHAQEVLSDASAELDALLAAAREEDAEAAANAAAQDAAASDPEPEEFADLDAFMANAGDDMNDELTRALDDEEAAAPDTTTQDTTQQEPDTQNAPAEDATGKSDPKLLNEDTLAQLLADAMPDETLEEDVAEDVVVSEPEANPAPESTESALVLGGDNRIADPEDAAGETAHAPIRARVMEMKRSDFEAALKSGALEEDEPTPDTTTGQEISAPSEADSDLTPEEEAELQRELAEVEAELGLGQTDTDAEPAGQSAETAPDADKTPHPDMAADSLADTQPQQAPSEKPRRGLAKLISGVRRQPGDVERIFDEADSQLGDQENSMRRNAIQHLRAAVAATRAEKSAGGRLDEAVDETPYRSDLDKVVRPRRPNMESAGALPATNRPSEQRPAPLKLVAEQRVDRARTPVQPRRVSASVETAPQKGDAGSDGGFAEFAANLGATDLSDLLEAAAAYMSDIEGQPEFSRPMLIAKLKEAVPGDFTREDGLRSFGHLLRNGKLRKIRAGRFAVTDHTEFREEARNAG